MNEKDDIYTEKEPIDFSIYNSQKDYLNSAKNKTNSDSGSLYIVVIHFPNHKSYSFQIPQTWTIRKLISFIKSTFKPEFKKNTSNFLFHGNQLSASNESPLKDFFQPDKINHIIITLKSISQENINENSQNINDIPNLFLKTNKEVFKSEEFSKMEKRAIDDYYNIFKHNTINHFPLMNPAYNSRREQITYDSALDKLAEFEPVQLEDFPFRNYFQLNIIFKCFISFFAFGIYIKGFNFILFLWVLIGYYWYCINNIIDEFYKKKIQEIDITEEEYKRIANEGLNKIKKLNKRGMFVLDLDDNEEDSKNKEKDKDKEKEKNDNNIISNVNKQASDIKTNIEEDVKEDNKISNEIKDKDGNKVSNETKDKDDKFMNRMTVLNDFIFIID